MDNPIFDLLCALGVCDRTALSVLATRVRDRDDVAVLRCARSGVIALSRVDHMSLAHYDQKAPTHPTHLPRTVVSTDEDTERRKRKLASLVRGKAWLDVGTGPGALLDALAPIAASYAGVEPQAASAALLDALGHPMFRRIEEAPAASYDVVTLNHVFEHVLDPLAMLAEIARVLRPEGRVVIEVPHARDFLLAFVDCAAFRAHTFWSEHLVLHTRESLQALVRAGGFEVHALEGVQRYPLANHLHWLSTGKPAGHLAWSALRDERLDAAWGDLLGRLDLTDTLVLEARRPRG